MLYRVLRAIQFLNDCDIKPNRQNIIKECGQGAGTALTTAEANGFVDEHGDGYYISEVGFEELESAVEHPYYESDNYFKQEVLTGLDAYGERSTLVNPALPGSKHHPNIDPDRGMVNMLDEVLEIEEEVLAVMERYDISAAVALEYNDDERVGWCDNCQKWGVFRRRSGSGNLRPTCTICEKRKKES